MSDIGVFRCSSYVEEEVEIAIGRCLDTMIGNSQITIKTPSTIFLKANLLRDVNPEDGATTHPNVIRGIAKYFQKRDCRVIVGDCPGSPLGFSEKTLRTVYQATGMEQLAASIGCELNYNTAKTIVQNPNSSLLKEITMSSAMLEADYIISVPKLKTHVMMAYTGAVKNLYGVVPGRIKLKYHFLMQDMVQFANLLVEISELIKPILTIIDAIDVMEGNGPTAGNKVHIGYIMAGSNTHELDLAATQIVGLDPKEIPTIAMAVRLGLLAYKTLSEIPIQGESMDTLNIRPIKKAFLSDHYTEPVIQRERCVACGLCVEACPTQTIFWKNKMPVIDADECIRCYCCHELCPHKAIDLRQFAHYS